MVAVIRTFHYERPCDPDDPGKRCAPEVKQLLPNFYSDLVVMETIQKVTRTFVEVKECLLHGDLHIDSVIVNKEELKVRTVL
jgi:5-methylthioribose kinase